MYAQSALHCWALKSHLMCMAERLSLSFSSSFSSRHLISLFPRRDPFKCLRLLHVVYVQRERRETGPFVVVVPPMFLSQTLEISSEHEREGNFEFDQLLLGASRFCRNIYRGEGGGPPFAFLSRSSGSLWAIFTGIWPPLRLRPGEGRCGNWRS